jgi:hypothetical protein
MFQFGGATGGGFGGGAEVPILFYSRRIGLERGHAVPIDGGGRLTGRAGRYSLGLLTIQSGEDDAAQAPATNFSVVRVRRDDMRRSSGRLRFSPRPRDNAIIRRYFALGALAYVEDGAGRLDTRDRDAEFAIEFQNGDRFRVNYNGTYESLRAPFPIATGVTVPVGAYRFDNVNVGFNRAARQPVSGNVSAEYGAFYNGHKTAVGVSSGRINLSPRLSVESTYSVNWVNLLQGSFTTHLAGSRVTWTATPFMFTSALLQYNSSSHALSANVRLRWEYRPGSELFVVFNEERDTRARQFPDLGNRVFIVKVNRLLRF